MTLRQCFARSPAGRGISRRQLYISLLTAALLAAPLPVWSADKTVGVPPGERGVKGGVVTTSEPIAAEVGGEILRRGGNAIDAAAAAMFALNVIEPQSSGIGGGGFMMIHLAKQKKTFVVDSRETAPAAADPEMFLQASDSNPFAFGTRSTSGIAVGVPGTIRGLDLALDRWGTISLAKALKPAIKLAKDGFRVSSRLEGSIAGAVATGGRLANEPGDPAYDEARSVFAPGGIALVEGDILKQPDLAKTLKRIARYGPNAFYKGPVAQAIIDTQLNTRAVADAADQAKLVGRMMLRDLKDYRVALRKPVEGKYRGFRIVSMPPPSSGGLTVIHILKLLERFPLGDESQGFGFGSTRTLNAMVEAMRLAFADRAVWMGDADFVDVPSTGLLSDGYVAFRSALIDPDSRQANVVADDPRPFNTAGLPTKKVQLATTNLPDEEGLNTTHLSIVDRYGNMVTYTNTIESGWGTGLMVPGYGFLLNNELTDFNRAPAFNPDPVNFNPGANDVAPGKRPRSSMAPTMIFKGKKPLAAYGSPGGSTIINSVVNMSLNLIDHKLPVQEAIDRLRISQTSANGAFLFEDGLDIQGLLDLGHSGFPFVIGSVQTVIIGRNKRQFGGADPRRIGRVVAIKRREIRRDDDDDDGGRRDDDDDDDGGRHGDEDDDD